MWYPCLASIVIALRFVHAVNVITIDTDTTVHTLYGQQMGGRKSYNPKNKGKKILADAHEYVGGELRNGDRSMVPALRCSGPADPWRSVHRNSCAARQRNGVNDFGAEFGKIGLSVGDEAEKIELTYSTRAGSAERNQHLAR